jgi:hypothetical protein
VLLRWADLSFISHGCKGDGRGRHPVCHFSLVTREAAFWVGSRFPTVRRPGGAAGVGIGEPQSRAGRGAVGESWFVTVCCRMSVFFFSTQILSATADFLPVFKI